MFYSINKANLETTLTWSGMYLAINRAWKKMPWVKVTQPEFMKPG